MKKKIIMIGVITVVVAVIIAIVLDATTMFTKSKTTGKLYRAQNVFEEIWNLVVFEKMGTKTVLTASTEGTELDYDLGFFEQINLPVSEEYTVVLNFHEGELNIVFFEKGRENDDIVPRYVYDDQSNTLYGNREEAYLFDKFLSLYDTWIGDDGKFTSDHPGEYTYVYDEYPSSHD